MSGSDGLVPTPSTPGGAPVGFHVDFRGCSDHGYESSLRRALPRPTRRTFVKGLAMGGVLGAVDLWTGTAWAQPAKGQPSPTLTGSTFDLRVGEIAGQLHRPPRAWPHHGQRFAAGADAALAGGRHGHAARREHAADEDTSIHWHGIVLPANMDGVPGLSFHGIARARPTSTASRAPGRAPTGTTATPGFRNSAGCTARSSSSRASRSRSRTTANTS